MTELVVADGEEELVREPGTMIRTEGELFYTGVEAMLEGMEIGAEKTERIAFAETARAEGVAGRELDVTLKVVSIQASEVPELSEELLEEMGVEGGETGLRESIRAQIAGSREEFSRNQARANLLQALIDANPFEMPANMIEEQLKMLMDELRLQEAYRGRDPRTVSFSEAQIADLRTRAEFAAKAGLILEHVAKVEELGVGDNEIEAKYHQLAEERGQSVEAIRGYFVKDDAVDELRARLLEEKTLDWLLERATLVSPEDAAADEPDDAEAGTDEAGTDEAGEE